MLGFDYWFMSDFCTNPMHSWNQNFSWGRGDQFYATVHWFFKQTEAFASGAFTQWLHQHRLLNTNNSECWSDRKRCGGSIGGWGYQIWQERKEETLLFLMLIQPCWLCQGKARKVTVHSLGQSNCPVANTQTSPNQWRQPTSATSPGEAGGGTLCQLHLYDASTEVLAWKDKAHRMTNTLAEVAAQADPGDTTLPPRTKITL